MIHGRYRDPRRSDVARGAVVHAGHVACRLTTGQDSIVARHTRLRRRAVVHQCGQTKSPRGVANVTPLRRGNVSNVLAARKQTVVASIADFWNPLENGVSMTRFARNQLVPPNERKSGRDVIKLFGGLNYAGKRRRRGRQKQHQH